MCKSRVGSKVMFFNTRSLESDSMFDPLHIQDKNGTHNTFCLGNIWTNASSYLCIEQNRFELPIAENNWALVICDETNKLIAHVSRYC